MLAGPGVAEEYKCCSGVRVEAVGLSAILRRRRPRARPSNGLSAPGNCAISSSVTRVGSMRGSGQGLRAVQRRIVKRHGHPLGDGRHPASPSAPKQADQHVMLRHAHSTGPRIRDLLGCFDPSRESRKSPILRFGELRTEHVPATAYRYPRGSPKDCTPKKGQSTANHDADRHIEVSKSDLEAHSTTGRRPMASS